MPFIDSVANASIQKQIIDFYVSTGQAEKVKLAVCPCAVLCWAVANRQGDCALGVIALYVLFLPSALPFHIDACTAFSLLSVYVLSDVLFHF